MESECGGIGANKATVIVLAVVCGLVFVAVVGVLIFRLCQRRIEPQQYPFGSRVLEPSARFNQP